MTPIFAIGDIHGQIDRLHEALEMIERDADRDAPVVFLGDYVDRGPDSRAVIDTLMRGQAEGRPWTCLMGNHDRYVLRFLDNPLYDDPQTSRPLLWTDPPLGGRATLASYGVDVDDRRPLEAIRDDAAEAIPQAHLDWIAALPRLHEADHQIFVHAGLRPGVPLDAQAEDDLIWIRKPFLETEHDWGRLVVHGHTALDFPQLYANRLNLDGGAGYGRPLFPALLLGREAFLLGPGGRTRL
ncbi:serine/threonine protein phosphatase [Salipiger manganoxidans]|uniref:metallophosphoesterase family protein n=2 Tax=Salipiger marinus TaxID=555512 RepID=UPI001E5B56CE|nr:metallophosphoesterase family protein [Salipiger manganoxidans]MCD1616982.1 serine/threonine protein phosphatase [Salipiger manganoxidans]